MSIKKIGNTLIAELTTNLDAKNGVSMNTEIEKELGEDDSITRLVFDLKNTFIFDFGFMRLLGPTIKDFKVKNKQIFVINSEPKFSNFLTDVGMDSVIKPVKASDLFPKPKGPKIDVAFVNPFIDATIKTLSIQCQASSEPQSPFLKDPNNDSQSLPIEIAAVIGLTSKVFTGSIAVCFPKETFLNLMENMLGEKYTEISKDIEDGAGELLNVIFGQAKIVLNEKGYMIEKAIPTIIRGQGLMVKHMSPSPVVVLPFKTNVGQFFIEIGTSAN